MRSAISHFNSIYFGLIFRWISLLCASVLLLYQLKNPYDLNYFLLSFLLVYNLMLTLFHRRLHEFWIKTKWIVVFELIISFILISLTFQQSPLSPFLPYSLSSIIAFSMTYGFIGAFIASMTLAVGIFTQVMIYMFRTVLIISEGMFIASIYFLFFNLFAYVFATYSYMVLYREKKNLNLTKQNSRLKTLQRLNGMVIMTPEAYLQLELFWQQMKKETHFCNIAVLMQKEKLEGEQEDTARYDIVFEENFKHLSKELELGHPVLNVDVSTCRYDYRWQSITIPLNYHEQQIGILFLSSNQRKLDTRVMLNPDDMEFIQTLAHLLTGLLYNMRQQEALRHILVGSERKRIAREMHDGLLQSLFFANSEASVCRSLISKPETSRELLQVVEQKLEQIQLTMVESLQETRDYIYNLRQFESNMQDLQSALHRMVERFQRQHNLQIHLYVDAKANLLTSQLSHTLLQLCSEALHNVGKHSCCNIVAIDLKIDDKITLIVQDDGIGMDSEKVAKWELNTHSFGLRGLLERVQSKKGTLELISAKGLGTKIIVHIPLNHSTYFVMEG